MELVIFDCDGVLFDSWRANVAYYNAVLRRMGLGPLDAEWERRVHFLASAQVYDEMFGAGSERAALARQAAAEIDYSPFFELMRPVPGLHDVLAELAKRYRLAMATNRGTTVQEVVDRFGLRPYLSLAVGVRDVRRPKPHPDLIVRCLEHFTVPPEEAAYVGDAESDRLAARAAGVTFVAVGPLPAEHRVEKLAELPALLDSLA